MPSITVVGAGVAGLTLGYQLARQGYQVTVLESHHAVGGLGRSWHYGDFHFDVGPHRFHTENPRVGAFVAEVLGEEALEIPRKSGVRMIGRFHEWPLRPSILLAMPFSLMARAALDLVKKERLSGESFEADIVNKYGRTLYQVFFAPYTEKFLFQSPAALHRDWGRAGVNRAVIDQRAHSDGLWALLRNTLLPSPVDTTFIYAPTGVGRFAEQLTAGIEQAGGRVLLERRVDAIETRDNRIVALRAGDERFPTDNVVWTAPITLANRLLGVEAIELDYLSTIFSASIRNLLLAGRCGRLWYNNMDHSIGQALTMSDKMLRGQMLASIDTADREFWAHSPEVAAPAVVDQPTPAAPVPPRRSVPPSGAPATTAPVLAAARIAAQRNVEPQATAHPAWRAGVWGPGGALALVLAWLSWRIGGGAMGPAYLAGYAAATVPGLPLGWRLFGRRHAAGWIAGGLLGYALTA